MRATSRSTPSSPSTPRRAMQSNASRPRAVGPRAPRARREHAASVASSTDSASPSMGHTSAALRHRGDAAERPRGEVGLADEAHVRLAAAGAQAQRMGQREARERFRIVPGGVRSGRAARGRRRAPASSSSSTRLPSEAVTSIGSPTARHPCRTPIPIGASEPIAAATTASVSTSPPCSWKVVRILRPSPAQPPTSGTPRPPRCSAPRTISRWSPARPSVSSSRTRCSRGSRASMQPRRSRRPRAGRPRPIAPRPSSPRSPRRRGTSRRRRRRQARRWRSRPRSSTRSAGCRRARC